MPFAGGYFLSYTYRSINAVIAPQLVSEMALDAAALGFLTASYFLAFAAFQLPLGLLLDRFGPRRVQAAMLLIATLGALIFAFGQNRETLIVGRALIGCGVAGGLMSAFKAITLWFPRARWPLVNGCYLAMGGLGAMAATEPAEALLAITDWRGLFLILGLATLAVALTIFWIVPEKTDSRSPAPLAAQIAGLRQVYRSPLFWRVAPITIAATSANLSIQGLWAGPWLRDIAGFDRDAVALGLFVMAACMTAGFVLNGILADLLERRGFRLTQIIAGGSLIFMAAQAVIAFQLLPTAFWPWALFGLFANMSMFAYPLLSRHFPLALAGRANTALNVLVFLSVFLVQYAIGGIIDLWPETASGYQPASYRWAFASALGLQVLALVWFWLYRPRLT